MIRPRSKPRPNRLKGTALAALRSECYYRDKGRCVLCNDPVMFNADHIHPKSYHMDHVRAKRLWGDVISNVRTLCGSCHRDKHTGCKGGKFQHESQT